MKISFSKLAALFVVAFSANTIGVHNLANAQSDVLPQYLADRGMGIPASIFATYIAPAQLQLYPFFAYARDNNREYQPAKLGFGLDRDFRGVYRSSESQLFMAYGVNDHFALEFEMAYIHATLEKASNDPSATPSKIEESGLADFEAQFRLILVHESYELPEFFSFLEITAPSQRSKLLIGDPEWDLRPGIGVIRGFSWGTLTSRVTVEYNRDDQQIDLGEFSVEYLKRLSPSWRVNFAIEGGETGAPDEWDLATGVQWRIEDSIFLKLDNAFGISSKATDWAPQFGIVVTFPN